VPGTFFMNELLYENRNLQDHLHLIKIYTVIYHYNEKNILKVILLITYYLPLGFAICVHPDIIIQKNSL